MKAHGAFHVKHAGRQEVLTCLEASVIEAERLDRLVAELQRWSPRINLVARSTLDDVWLRHVADSAQLLRFAPDGAESWADLGAGGGFPGLVLAALAADRRPDLRLTLVESDGRKCAFLRSAARAMGVSVDVLTQRIEALPEARWDIVSARALAPLPKLLDHAAPRLAPGGRALFLKGAAWRSELTEARRRWHMEVDVHPSATHRDAVVLVLTEIARD